MTTTIIENKCRRIVGRLADDHHQANPGVTSIMPSLALPLPPCKILEQFGPFRFDHGPFWNSSIHSASIMLHFLDSLVHSTSVPLQFWNSLVCSTSILWINSVGLSLILKSLEHLFSFIFNPQKL